MTNLLNNFTPQQKLLLAVSGGVDSVVLAHLCWKAGLYFELAHVNFRLRGAESEGDELFVRELAETMGKPLHIKQADTISYAEAHKLSVQVAAREIRYQWFRELMQLHHFDYLITAHHLDDNIETVLMNFFRGTGVSGLRGMLPLKDQIARPLLSVPKTDIIEYAKTNSLSWREDSSNASDKYSRNYFRQHIIPALQQVYPEVLHNLADNIRRFRDVELVYNDFMASCKSSLLEKKGEQWHIPILKLKKKRPLETIAYEIIRDFGFSPRQVPDFLRLLDADQGKFIASDTHRIIRNRKWLIIAPRNAADTNYFVVEGPGEKLMVGSHMLHFERSAVRPLQPGTEQLDLQQLRFPLIVRKWRAGDYFYPLGLKKKKKIARFLIDKKLSPTEKENVWVVESGKKICWVVGQRIDERFKVTPATREVLCIRYEAK